MKQKQTIPLSVASEDCGVCRGTGKVIGWGAWHGARCPMCVTACEDCDVAIAWEHDDERGPRRCAACELENSTSAA